MRAGERLADGRTTSAVPTIGDRARAVRVVWDEVRFGWRPRPSRRERLRAEWVPNPERPDRLTLQVHAVDAEHGYSVENVARVHLFTDRVPTTVTNYL